MFVYPEIKKHSSFEWKDLHKRLFKCIHFYPTESCLAEGDFMEQVWLYDIEKQEMFLIHEHDTREN